MNPKTIEGLLIIMAEFYGKDFSEGTIRIMAEDYRDKGLSVEDVRRAWKVYRVENEKGFFPKPAELIKIIRPKLDETNEAIEAASRIVESVSRFGWCNVKEAKDYIGEVGWEVVKRHGGWQYVCENLGLKINVSTFQAQCRDAAKSMLARNKLGLREIAPSFASDIPMIREEKQESENRKKLAGLVKSLTEKTGKELSIEEMERCIKVVDKTQGRDED